MADTWKHRLVRIYTTRPKRPWLRWLTVGGGTVLLTMILVYDDPGLPSMIGASLWAPVLVYGLAWLTYYPRGKEMPRASIARTSIAAVVVTFLALIAIGLSVSR